MFGILFRLVGRVVGFAVKAAIFVAALAAVGAGTMYLLFDAEQYKKVASQRMADVTGRIVSIEGPVELELSLPPRIILNDIRIKNARWGTRPDMARIRRMEMRINPLRAIAGDSGATDVRLAGVDLYLETGPGGIGNWEFSPVVTGGAAAVAGAVAALDALGLLAPTVPGASVSVAGANVTFRDGATGRVQSLALGNTAVEVVGGSSQVLPTPLAVAAVTDKSDDPCEKKEGSLSLH